MSVSFTAASSTSLAMSTAGTFPLADPFTVGAWLRCRAGSASTLAAWTLAATSDYFFCGQTNSVWEVNANDGTAGTTISLTGLFAVNVWTHVIARFITATNRRASGLRIDGTFVTGSNAVSVGMANAVRFFLGGIGVTTPTGFLDVDIADFWWTNVDIGSAVAADLTYAEHLALISPQNNAQQARKLKLFQSFRSGWEQRTPEEFLNTNGVLMPQWTPSATKPVGGLQPPWVALPSWNRAAMKGKVPTAAAFVGDEDGVWYIPMQAA